MLRRLKTQVGLHKWLVIALAAVVALGSVGITYASLQGGAQTNGVVPTCNCCSSPFTWVVSNDDGKVTQRSPYGSIDPGDNGGGTKYDRWGAQSSDDPSEPQTVGVSCARYDKDVARTTAMMSCDRWQISVLLENAYPSYYPTVFFGLKCSGSLPTTITGIVIDNPYPQALTVSISGIYVGQTIPQCKEVVGALQVHVEQEAAQNTSYKFNISITIQCQPEATCGTAYAYLPGKATCFLNLGFARWGWTNGPLGPGNYEFQLWANAAGCKTSKGRLVGTVTVNYSGLKAVVTYQMYEGNWMTATHLYVGKDRLPKDNKGNPTITPGLYPYKHDPLNNVTTDSYTVTGLSGSIYIVAHAAVCWYK